jgi:mono/diheme cytochrome c family protein
MIRALQRTCVTHPLLALLLAACGGAGGKGAADSVPAALGARGYGVCLPCHGENGMGVPNAYPGLVGTPWVTGDPEVLIKLTLHGLQGPIQVNGKRWNALMMPLANLPDAEIAEALTHTRTSWGNAASPITAEQVAAVRAAHAGRTKPWTAAELGNP